MQGSVVSREVLSTCSSWLVCVLETIERHLLVCRHCREVLLTSSPEKVCVQAAYIASCVSADGTLADVVQSGWLSPLLIADVIEFYLKELVGLMEVR